MQRTLLFQTQFDRSSLSPHLHYITPTPQAARTLRVPHRSLETLAQQICHQQGIAIAPILTAHRTWRHTIRTTLNVVDVDGIARTWKRAVNALVRAKIDLTLLESVEIGNLQQLADLTRTYQQQLQEFGAIDPAQLLWKASQLPSSPQPLAIYGYFAPQPDELELIDTLAADGSILVLPDQEFNPVSEFPTSIETLQKRGWKFPSFNQKTRAQASSFRGNSCWEEYKLLPKTPLLPSALCPLPSFNLPSSITHPKFLTPNLQLYTYPHQEAEVRGALSQIKQLLLEGVPAKDIVLVARDDAFYGPMVLDVAWEYELPIRALYATPLNTTRLGAWVRSLLEVMRTNFPFEATAKLFSHPLASLRLQAVWGEVRQRHPEGLKQWEHSLAEDLSILKWKQRDTRSNWVKRLREVLNTLEVRQRCRRWAREIIAYSKLDESLDTIAQPPGNRLTLEEFAREVIDSLNLLTVPAQPGRGGVELHTPKALWGANYQHVFVLGMAEGLFPAPLKDDPVLDFYTRKQLKRQGFLLEDAIAGVRREGLSFELLLQVATQTLTFSYPQCIGKEEMLPSPYLTKLNLKPQVPQTIAIASWEEARKVRLAGLGDSESPGNLDFDDPVFDRVVSAWRVEQRRENETSYDEYDGVVQIGINPKHHIFSASQLTQLGQCGFKWFAGYLLKLAELTEADTEFDGKLRGRLYHKTLELVVQKAKDQPDVQQALLDALDDAFAEAEKSENLLGISTWKVRRAEQLSILRRTIAHESFMTPETQVLGVELKFRGQWYGLNVEGIVDRIDATPHGLHLIEYKNLSSKPTAAKDASGKANLDLQLPLYRQVAATTLFPEQPVAKAYYYSISKQKKIEAEVEEQELENFVDQIRQNLTQGHYPVQPDIEGKACQYCCQDLVCRQGSRLKRKIDSSHSCSV